MSQASGPKQNQLLASLSEDEYAPLQEHLTLEDLELGLRLYEAGIKPRHIYFPTNSIVSLLYVMESGKSAEIALVGSDGMVGVGLVMGGGPMPNEAWVQSAGQAYSLPAAVFKREFEKHTGFHHLLLRYCQVLLTQMAQTAVCNRHHSLDQQLCRWLLLSVDRLPSESLTMTQELIANMLGVRREGVTEAAGKLQRVGAISYKRGHIQVLDRQMLEGLSCECYEVVKRETKRLLDYAPRTAA